MTARPWGMATAIGSLPLCDPGEAADFVLDCLPRIPHWPQLPRRCPAEGMLEQFVAPLRNGGLLEAEGTAFRTDQEDWVDRLTAFYQQALAAGGGEAAALEGFALAPEGAAGFYAFMRKVALVPPPGMAYLKGQVTGPVTLGLQLTDAGGRPSFYSEELRELLLETLALQALWQAEEYRKLGYPAIIFFDDPGLCSYGQSATVGLSGAAVTSAYAYLARRLQERGALAGIHACAGVEWSLVLPAGLDIVNADVYSYLPSLLAAAVEVRTFLEGGGTLAWGLVPTRREGPLEKAESLWARFREGAGKLAARGVPRALLQEQWLVTPACGTGSLEPAAAAAVYRVLKEMERHPCPGD